MHIDLKSRSTSAVVKAWEALRWDIHELVMPALIHALIMAFLFPQIQDHPDVWLPIMFYMVWFVWNILTARTFAQIGFRFELFFAGVYFVLLTGLIISLTVILLT